MHVHGDAAAVVPDGARAIHVDGDLNVVAVTGEMLVDGIVEHLKDAVMESALVRVADVHSGTFANGFEPLQFVDLGGVVFGVHIGPRIHRLFGRLVNFLRVHYQ